MRAKEARRAVPSGARTLGAVVTRHVAHKFVATTAVVPGLANSPVDPATGSVISFQTHRVVPVFEAGGEFRLGETKGSLRARCLLWGTCRAKVSRRAVLAFSCRFKVLVLPAFARNASLLPNTRLVRSLRAWRGFLHSGCRAIMAFWTVHACGLALLALESAGRTFRATALTLLALESPLKAERWRRRTKWTEVAHLTLVSFTSQAVPPRWTFFTGRHFQIPILAGCARKAGTLFDIRNLIHRTVITHALANDRILIGCTVALCHRSNGAIRARAARNLCGSV